MKYYYLIISSLFSFKAISQNSDLITIDLLKSTSDVLYIPCELNGIKQNLIFDTGASFVSISSSVFEELLKTGSIKSTDIKEKVSMRIADGSIVSHQMVNISTIKLGPSYSLSNVLAVVSPNINSPLLLGQSVISRLGKWSIDNYKMMLTFNHSNTNPSIETDYSVLLKEGQAKMQFVIDGVEATLNGQTAAYLVNNGYYKINDLGDTNLLSNGNNKLLAKGANNYQGYRLFIAYAVESSLLTYAFYDMIFTNNYSSDPTWEFTVNNSTPFIPDVYQILDTDLTCTTYKTKPGKSGNHLVFEFCHDDSKSTIMHAYFAK